MQWSAARLRRVLNAAIASPISAQDLAEAEVALQQGFTGSLSRVPTSSSQREAAMSEEAGSGTQEPPAAAAAGEAGETEGVAGFLLHQGDSGRPATQPAAVAAPAAAAGDDAVAAELAAAAAQQEAELMDMVSGCAYRAPLSRHCRTNEQDMGGVGNEMGSSESPRQAISNGFSYTADM